VWGEPSAPKSYSEKRLENRTKTLIKQQTTYKRRGQTLNDGPLGTPTLHTKNQSDKNSSEPKKLKRQEWPTKKKWGTKGALHRKKTEIPRHNNQKKTFDTTKKALPSRTRFQQKNPRWHPPCARSEPSYLNSLDKHLEKPLHAKAT